MSLREKTEEDLEQDLAPFGFLVTGREIFDDDDDTYKEFSPDSWVWELKQDF
jgi:hypothetical protein